MNSQNDRYFFRGKRKDNAMWMHGSLVAFPNDNEHYGIWSENAQSYLWVMPDTIGQCTGLKDKNDKLIFEGDILAQATHNTTLITVARWSDGGWLNGGARECQYSSRADSYIFGSCEIIGNIHDNPELLEVHHE